MGAGLRGIVIERGKTLDDQSERQQFVDYRLEQLERRVNDHEQIFVRLERYIVLEKAVIAIFGVLSMAAFGLLWQAAGGA